MTTLSTPLGSFMHDIFELLYYFKQQAGNTYKHKP